MFDKHRNKLGLSCAKLRWSYASQPAHLAYHSTFACPLRLFPSILTNFYCHHIFQNEFRLFSNDQLIYAVFHLQNNWGRLSFTKMWGCLPSSKNLRLSSIHMLEGQFILIRQFGYFSGPRRFCQQTRAAHALRSDQNFVLATGIFFLWQEFVYQGVWFF